MNCADMNCADTTYPTDPAILSRIRVALNGHARLDFTTRARVAQDIYDELFGDLDAMEQTMKPIYAIVHAKNAERIAAAATTSMLAKGMLA